MALPARVSLVFPGRALAGIGDGLSRLPLRADQLVALQPAHGRINGAARKAGHLHHAEAIPVAGVDSLEDQGRRVRKLRFRLPRCDYTYVACYLTR